METRELIDKFEKHHDAVVKLLNDANKRAEETEIKHNTRLQEIEQQIVRRRSGVGDIAPPTWGRAVVEAPEFKAFVQGGARGRVHIELKTVSTITSAATFGAALIAPDVRTDTAVYPRRRMTVRNLLAPGQTTSNVVQFPRQSARQNNAAVVAEGAVKPQSDLNIDQIQATVQTIAHFMKASRQVLDDAPMMASLIDSELRYGLDFAEEVEFLTGDGTGVHLLGLIPQASAYSAPFALTGETAIDRILLALIQAELALLPADGVVLNITDWGKMRLTKDGMGRYLLGDDPSAPPPAYLWGVPLVVTPAITAGNFLVGAFSTAAQIFDRLAPEVMVSTEDSDNFQRNLVTIRGERRVALATKRPAAFVTGALP